VSLSFRLYGNMFAGETMLETMARVPHTGWLVQIPFNFLELLVGLVQALVFMLLIVALAAARLRARSCCSPIWRKRDLPDPSTGRRRPGRALRTPV